ncbi:MAG TPA: carboxypeptidase-like regulatory domain-containing protein, partial [Chryseosolibacter sp.]|nr:carboxypeptidase-like regulatory domain-containing protein [Chryseosolibacter sp.]
IEVKRGYQYQVNVVLSGKTQTFNRSRAATSELPLNAPKVIGTVRDQNDREVAGAIITQQNTTFTVTTDPNGRFVLAMSPGPNVINVRFGTLKPLEVTLELKQDSTYYLDVVLVEGLKKYQNQKSSATFVKSP